MSRYCHTCGESAVEFASYCHGCGTELVPARPESLVAERESALVPETGISLDARLGADTPIYRPDGQGVLYLGRAGECFRTSAVRGAAVVIQTPLGAGSIPISALLGNGGQPSPFVPTVVNPPALQAPDYYSRGRSRTSLLVADAPRADISGRLERRPRIDGSYFEGLTWLVLLSVLVGWVPVLGGFVAAYFAGRHSGGMGSAVMVSLTPALIIAVGGSLLVAAIGGAAVAAAASGLLFALAAVVSIVYLLGAVVGASTAT